MADLSDKIEEVAEGPAEVSGDQGSVKSQDISKLIEADRYLATKTAMGTTNRGIRFTRMVPDGTI
jgi:hypothetical protein